MRMSVSSEPFRSFLSPPSVKMATSGSMYGCDDVGKPSARACVSATAKETPAFKPPMPQGHHRSWSDRSATTSNSSVSEPETPTSTRPSFDSPVHIYNDGTTSPRGIGQQGLRSSLVSRLDRRVEQMRLTQDDSKSMQQVGVQFGRLGTMEISPRFEFGRQPVNQDFALDRSLIDLYPFACTQLEGLFLQEVKWVELLELDQSQLHEVARLVETFCARGHQLSLT